MQDPLFPEDPTPDPPGQQPPAPGQPLASGVGAAPVSDAMRTLALRVPALARLGTSSWSFPGWQGLVWDGVYGESKLSRQGLWAYARHPLLRTVSLDRAFYKPLTALQYAQLAAQVDEGFRFMVKAPSSVTDATIRLEQGRGIGPNPHFLDPALAIEAFVQPAVQGLGPKLGALVFQISPLPSPLLGRISGLLDQLARLLAAIAPELAQAPHVTVAVEVRDPEWLTPAFAQVLKSAGATYCLGLHARMPPIQDQLPMLRALWPGPLVCRWNLHARHGAYGYAEAKDLYAPFDRLVDPDPDTRTVLAKVLAATTRAGYPALVSINNKAEGSAPLSVVELAKALP